MSRTPSPRILAVRSDSLGDVLLTEPAIRGLAATGRVTLLCGPIGAAAAALLPGVSETWTYDTPWIAADPDPFDTAAFGQLVRRVRYGRFDRAVVFTSDRQSALPMALALRLAGAGHIAATSAEYPGSLLDVRVRPRAGATPHEVERNLQLLDAIGVDRPDDISMQVRGAPLPRTLDRLPAEYVVVHPSANAAARTAAPDRWSAIMHALRLAGRAVVVTGGAGDEVARRVARDAAADVATALPPAVDAVGLTTLAQLATVLGDALAVCVGNTGAMHLAAATGTPVVALFPPTVPVERWRPWQVPHVVLGDQGIACAPCYRRVCPFVPQPCIDVEPDAVVEAVASLTWTSARPLAVGVGR